jgi:hypothetical protein
VRWIQIRVAMDMTTTTSGDLENIHMQTELRVPSKEAMVVVDLHTGRTIIFRDEGTARVRISRIRQTVCVND